MTAETGEVAGDHLGAVVHMTSVHRPEDPRILLKEAHSLAAAGYDVTIVAGEAPERADARGVRFVGVHGDRPRDYVRDPERGLGARIRRLVTTTVRVWRSAARLRADIYHFHDPELLPIGLMLKLSGRCVVYDAHEDLPKQILDKRYLPSLTRRPLAALIGALERLTVAAIDATVTATPPIARRFPAAQATVVQNFPLVEELRAPHPSPYDTRPPLVVYVGGMTVDRGFHELVEAGRLLSAGGTGSIVIAGRLKPAGLEDAIKPGSNVTFDGWLDRDGVAELLGRARAGIVTFHPTANYREAYPIKLFEYMSASVPVIASDFPIWREIVESSGAGLLVDPRDPRAIADAIQWIIEHEEEAEAMGQRGRQAVEQRYNWDAESRKLLELYRTLMARQRQKARGSGSRPPAQSRL